MEGFRSSHWYTYGSPFILSPFLIALVIWLSRGSISRLPWLWYLWAAIGICAVVINFPWELTATALAPNVPLMFRVLHYLCLALLVIAVLVTRPRKKV